MSQFYSVKGEINIGAHLNEKPNYCPVNLDISEGFHICKLKLLVWFMCRHAASDRLPIEKVKEELCKLNYHIK